MNKQNIETMHNSNSLDACSIEPFTCKSFYDLLLETNDKNEDYYLAKLTCINSSHNNFHCYDAKHLVKYVFETVVTSEGRKIRIKNFTDPIHGYELSEIDFYRLKNTQDLPLRAEYVGNHVGFLESNVFRSKIFNQEDPLDLLSVNFEFNDVEKRKHIKKKGFFKSLLTFLLICIVIGIGIYFTRRYKESVVENTNENEEEVEEPKNEHKEKIEEKDHSKSKKLRNRKSSSFIENNHERIVSE